MQKSLRITFRRGDWFAIAAVLLMVVGSLAVFLPHSSTAQAATVQIYLNGGLIEELPITVDRELTISDDYTNIVCIRGGKVSISESDCPGADCVHSGWVSSPGRSIVCLPNRVEVRVVGTESDVDFVVR